MNCRYLTVAELDQLEAVTYYESQEPGLGAEFIEALDRTVGRILDHPYAGSPGLRSTRSYQTERFPFSVIYRVDHDEILIVAIQHHSRDPRRWEDRIFE